MGRIGVLICPPPSLPITVTLLILEPAHQILHTRSPTPNTPAPYVPIWNDQLDHYHYHPSGLQLLSQQHRPALTDDVKRATDKFFTRERGLGLDKGFVTNKC